SHTMQECLGTFNGKPAMSGHPGSKGNSTETAPTTTSSPAPIGRRYPPPQSWPTCTTLNTIGRPLHVQSMCITHSFSSVPAHHSHRLNTDVIHPTTSIPVQLRSTSAAIERTPHMISRHALW